MKTIVTHMNPDLDAIASVWLLKRFGGSEFRDAKVSFVPAGATYKDMPVDGDPDIVHVDTGLGKLDHHQSNEYTAAAKKVYEYLGLSQEAVKRLVDLVVAVDHAKDIAWQDAGEDKWELWLPSLISGYRLLATEQYDRQLAFGLEAMDAAYKTMSNKVEAEKEIVGGTEFDTRWGKAIALLTYNDSVLDMGIRRGYVLVARKDPRKGYVRVTGRSDKGVDLTQAHAEFANRDNQATWYLHPSKVLLRNGSTKNPKMRATQLTLAEIVEVLKEA